MIQGVLGNSVAINLSAGGTISGDLTVTGDMQVQGGGSLTVDQLLDGDFLVDNTSTEALLVRKNSDGGDIFTVDTTNSDVTVTGQSIIDQNSNVIALSIDSEATTVDVLKVVVPTTTTANILSIGNANGLTSGKIAYFHSDSSSTTSRNIVEIINDNTAATGATVLKIQQDSTGAALHTVMAGTAGATNDSIRIETAVDATANTFNAIRFLMGHSGGSSTDAGYLGFLAEGTWTGTGSTRDSAFVVMPMLNGSEFEGMRITSGGKVGIGETSPTGFLHISPPSGSAPTMYFEQYTSGTGETLGQISFGNRAIDGQLAVIECGNDGANDSAFLSFETEVTGGALTECMRIDSSGNVVTGHTTAQIASGFTAKNQSIGTDAASGFTAARFSANDGSAKLNFAKSRHASAGSHTVVADNDTLGDINFTASDGTDFGTLPVRIRAEVDDASPASSSIGGALLFSTAAGASSDDLTERMRIDSSGNVGLGVTPNSAPHLHIAQNASGKTEYIRLDNTGGVDYQFHLGYGTADNFMMRDSAGNVLLTALGGDMGIGTGSPAVDLDIEDTTTSSATQGGNLRLGSNDGAVMGDGHRLGVIEFAGAEDTSSTMTVGARIEAIANATWSASENSGYLRFLTTDGDASQSEVLRLKDNKDSIFYGNVGIGSTAPTSLLHISNNSSDVTANPQLKLTNLGAGDSYITFALPAVDWALGCDNTDDSFKIIKEDDVSDGGANEFFTIDTSGNIGIGTASPGDLLHLSGSVSTTVGALPLLRIDNTGTSANYRHEIGLGPTSGGTAIPPGIVGYVSKAEGSGHSKGDLYFATRNVITDTTPTVRMTIQGDGNIGIGATTVDELLHLESATSAKPVLKIENTNSDATGGILRFQKNTSDEADNDILGEIHAWGNDDGATATQFANIKFQSTDVTNGTEDGSITFSTLANGSSTDVVISSGNMGIGKTPTVKLDVNGNILLPSAYDVRWGDGNQFIEGTDSVGLKFYASGSARMIIDTNSRISLSNNDVSSSTNTIFGKLAFDTVDGNELNNVVIGEQAGELVNADTNDNNVYIGYQAATGGTGGRSDNVAIGYRAWGSGGSTNTVGGNENVFIGSLSGNGTWTTAGCDSNTAVGYGTLAGALNGAGSNTAIGRDSLAAVTTGDNNCGLGEDSGDVITTGIQNTIIGSDSDPSANSGANQATLGYGVTGVADNSVTLGNASVTAVYMAQDSDTAGEGAIVHCLDVKPTGAVLHENLLTNSGFDVWSNATAYQTGSNFLEGDVSDFDTISGWATDGNGTITSVSGGQAGNCMQNAQTSGGGNTDINHLMSGLVVGKLYKFSAYVKQGTQSGALLDMTVFNNGQSAVLVAKTGIVTTGSWVQHSVVWEATESNPYIFFRTKLNNTETMFMDTATVYEITPACVASDALAFDGWKKPATMDLFREHNGSNVQEGSFYSLKITNGAGTEEIGVYWDKTGDSVQLEKFSGRTITIGAWVKTDGASQIRLGIYNGSAYSYTSYNAGTGWEWLELTATVSASPTTLYPFLVRVKDGDTAYISQPMLVFGSSIGEGNYTRPQGEIVWTEKLINSTLFDATGMSDVSATALNLEADTNGMIPKGAKAICFAGFVRDSGSAAVTDGVYFALYPTSGKISSYISCAGTTNDTVFRYGTIWVDCDSSGDLLYAINASGSGTLDPYVSTLAVQLR